MPGDEVPGGGDPDESNSGLPPHPLDRVWFHPSELSAYMASAPERRARRDWTVVAMGAVAGVVLTMTVLAAAGTFDGSGSTSAVTPGEAATVTDPLGASPVEHLVAFGAASVVAVRVVSPPGSGAPVTGSGVVLGRSRVLTAASLLPAGSTVTVSASDGRVLDATIAGVDPDTDLALLRVSKGDLSAANLGSSDGLQVGEPVVALGAAGGSHRWASRGVIAALDRLVGVSGLVLAGIIETDIDTTTSAAGGALLNDSGEVIGILSRAALGRALPIDVARDVADQLATTGRARHGWLGVSASDAGDREGGGARVDGVALGSPAAAAGLAGGDVITSIGSDSITDTPDLMAAVLRRKPGDPVAVIFWHGDHKLHKQVSLGERAIPNMTTPTAALASG